MSLFERAAPLLHAIEPERAHRLSLAALRAGLHPRYRMQDPALAVEVAGLRFAHPVGVAAGYDKDGEAVAPLLACGFSHVEVGTVTPRPQPGNARPRVFRLPEDRAVVNRYGFNSAGAEAVRERLERVETNGMWGVNVGANKETVANGDVAADYVQGIERLGGRAAYVTVNVSSPNTPGLRALQGDPLRDLLDRARDAVDALPHRTRLFLKIAPDLAEQEMDAIAAAAGPRVDALIVSNTTVAREGLRSPHGREAGGLSGRPLMEPSTRVLANMRERLPLMPLVGAGGVEDADTAWRKVEAGASLVQLYTALVYRGPGVVREIVEGLSARCAREGVRMRDVAGRRAGELAKGQIAGDQVAGNV